MKARFLKISLIILAILFIYTAFSTFYHDTALIGNIGKLIGNTNIRLFGYLAYVNIFILLYPLYKLYTDSNARRTIDFYLAWMLIFISLILLSALILEKQDVGMIGMQIVSFLKPYIGMAGLWLFWLMVSALALVFVWDEEIDVSQYFHLPSFPALSFAWLGSGVAGLKSLSKNPFSSPSLDNDLMPIFEREHEAENPVMPKRTIKKSVPEEEVLPQPKFKREEKKTVPKKTMTPKETVVDSVRELEILDDKVLTPKSEKKAKTNPTHANVKIVSELEENSKLMDEIDKGKVAKPKNFKLPKVEFLQKAPKSTKKVNEAEIDRKIEDLLSKLAQFRIDGDVIRTYSGPLVTTFEFKPAPNVKVSKILGLQDDLAMALSAETIRIQAPIPGRDVVGIEIPNESIDTIYLREILESDIFKESSSP